MKQGCVRLISALLFALVLLRSVAMLPVLASDDGSVSVSASVSAQSYCLMDADSGEILSSVGEDKPLPMASTTKLMTCLLALEKASLSDVVSIHPTAVGTEGSSVYLTKGESLSMENLLYALMLESANDAAVAIALHLSASIAEFSELMNEKAREIGMVNTTFQNPHGLPAENHKSTAKDLAILMSEALKNPAFCEIIATQTKTIPAPNGASRFLSNHNRLLRSYEACIGGKTGFTKAAGRCLVTAAEQNHKKLVCATLAAPDDWNDHQELYEYGFSLYSPVSICEAASLKFTVPVVGGTRSDLPVVNIDSVSLLLRKDQHVETVVELPRFLYAPILMEGQALGEAVFYQNGREVKRIPLVATETVAAREVKLSLLEKIRNWFRR